MLEMYKAFQKKYKGLKALIVLTNIDNSYISYSSPEILKTLKENMQCLYFGNIADFNLTDVATSFKNRNQSPLTDGDAFLFRGNEIIKIKTIMS